MKIASRSSSYFLGTVFELWEDNNTFIFIARNKTNIEHKCFMDADKAYEYYRMMV